jgi:hypothetical protein
MRACVGMFKRPHHVLYDGPDQRNSKKDDHRRGSNLQSPDHESVVRRDAIPTAAASGLQDQVTRIRLGCV